MTYDLRPGKPLESKLQRGECREGAQSFGKVLKIFGETPVAPEPGETALDFWVRPKAPTGRVDRPSTSTLGRSYDDTPRRDNFAADIGRCDGGWCRGHRLSRRNGASAEGHAADSDNHPAA